MYAVAAMAMLGAAFICAGQEQIVPAKPGEVPEANQTAPSTNALPAELNRTLPILFLVGDSTVYNRAPGLVGWGNVLDRYFDTKRIIVANHAKPGRSSRTFQTQGWWAQTLAAARPGDFVIIQMGHNDGTPLNDTNRARGTIPGLGEESRAITNAVLGRPEVVHTYGWYLRNYISDARAKGMVPIICSPVPRLPKAKDTVEAGYQDPAPYVKWSEQIAEQEHVFFIPLNQLVLTNYVGLTPKQIQAQWYAPRETTHANAAGATLNASEVVAGLRMLTNCPLTAYLVK